MAAVLCGLQYIVHGIFPRFTFSVVTISQPPRHRPVAIMMERPIYCKSFPRAQRCCPNRSSRALPGEGSASGFEVTQIIFKDPSSFSEGTSAFAASLQSKIHKREQQFVIADTDPESRSDKSGFA
jgi:hypothetical protein